MLTLYEKAALNAIRCLPNIMRKEGILNTLVDMRYKLEEQGGIWQASPPYSTPLTLGILVHQSLSKTSVNNAERCTLFILFFSVLFLSFVLSQPVLQLKTQTFIHTHE